MLRDGNRLKIQDGNRTKSSLMGNEERRFMWNLAFFFTIKHGGATAFKSFTSIRSFITFHGIFMAPGYDLGADSTWNRKIERRYRGGGIRH